MDRLLRTSQEAISPSAMRSDTRPKAPAAAAIGTRKQGNKEINKEIKKETEETYTRSEMPTSIRHGVAALVHPGQFLTSEAPQTDRLMD